MVLRSRHTNPLFGSFPFAYILCTSRNCMILCASNLFRQPWSRDAHAIHHKPQDPLQACLPLSFSKKRLVMKCGWFESGVSIGPHQLLVEDVAPTLLCFGQDMANMLDAFPLEEPFAA